MNRALQLEPHAGLARHPKLVAAAIGLAMLLFATPLQAEGRGSAQNPIYLPGTEATTPRIAPAPRKDRVVLRRGDFAATLYALPARALRPGVRPRLSHDSSPAGAVARDAFASLGAGDVELAGTGLKLSLQPSWDVELEGRGVQPAEFANPEAFLRTRGIVPSAQAGVEVRFF